MRVKLFTFRYSATLGGFDDTPLVDYVRDKEIVSFREHFFSVNEVPHVLASAFSATPRLDRKNRGAAGNAEDGFILVS